MAYVTTLQVSTSQSDGKCRVVRLKRNNSVLSDNGIAEATP